MTSNPFDYVKSIQKTKVDLIRSSDDIDEAIKGYIPYQTNKALSFYIDSILYANEMNLHHNLDKDQQFAFYLNSIRSMNRTFTWFKKDQDNNIDKVMKYYSVNRHRAKEILELLTESELKTINSQLNDGGNIIKRT